MTRAGALFELRLTNCFCPRRSYMLFRLKTLNFVRVFFSDCVFHITAAALLLHFDSLLSMMLHSICFSHVFQILRRAGKLDKNNIEHPSRTKEGETT